VSELKPGLIYYTSNPIATIKGEMTLRDYFAAKAMQSLLTTPTKDWPSGSDLSVSEEAYAMADAMLEVRMQRFMEKNNG